MIAIASIRKQSKHTCTRLSDVEISDARRHHLYLYASLNFRTRVFNQISFTMSPNSSPSNPADATTTSVIISIKIVAFIAMMFFKMTFVQIKTERSAENDPSSSKILGWSRSRGYFRADSLTRATDEKDLRRSCPAKKKLKSGHGAGTAGVGSPTSLAVGTKTGDRIGRVRRDGGAPWGLSIVDATRRDEGARNFIWVTGWPPSSPSAWYQHRWGLGQWRRAPPRRSWGYKPGDKRDWATLWGLLSLVPFWRKVILIMIFLQDCRKALTILDRFVIFLRFCQKRVEIEKCRASLWKFLPGIVISGGHLHALAHDSSPWR